MTGDVAKLPKWARDRIEGLERQLGEREHDLVKALRNYPESKLRIDAIGSVSEGFYMPNRTWIEWTLPLGKIGAFMTTDGKLRIQGDAFGLGRFVVIPEASNSLHLDMMQRPERIKEKT